jgi:anti-sigma regulatory factor (Ser/Thr protein kinase)
MKEGVTSRNIFSEELTDVLRQLQENHPGVVSEIDPEFKTQHADILKYDLFLLLKNLIVNALDKTVGSKTVTFKADRMEQGGQILAKLTVSDNGKGMTPEQADNIRHRVGFTTKTKELGQGMGLPGVWEIIDRYQGTMEVESVQGQGTTFFITLPLMSAKTSDQAMDAGPVGQWQERLWRAVEQEGLERVKNISPQELAGILSRKFGIFSSAIDREMLVRNGLSTKLPDDMFALSQASYDKNKREVGFAALRSAGILGPGVYYDRSSLMSMNKLGLAINIYVFHEFCEYLAAAEGPEDPLMERWHGHHSVDREIERHIGTLEREF